MKILTANKHLINVKYLQRHGTEIGYYYNSDIDKNNIIYVLQELNPGSKLFKESPHNAHDRINGAFQEKDYLLLTVPDAYISSYLSGK